MYGGALLCDLSDRPIFTLTSGWFEVSALSSLAFAYTAQLGLILASFYFWISNRHLWAPQTKKLTLFGLLFFLIHVLPFLWIKQQFAYYATLSTFGIALIVGLALASTLSLDSILIIYRTRASYLLVFSSLLIPLLRPTGNRYFVWRLADWGEKARQISENIQEIHPELPRSSELYFYGADEKFREITFNGSLFRRIYRDTSLQIRFLQESVRPGKRKGPILLRVTPDYRFLKLVP